MALATTEASSGMFCGLLPPRFGPDLLYLNLNPQKVVIVGASVHIGGLYVNIWPLGLVGDIILPLGSAKTGVIRQKIPDLDIRLACHIDPDTRDTATPHVRGSGAPSAQT